MRRRLRNIAVRAMPISEVRRRNMKSLSANDPNDVKYLKAMATSYACLGNKSKVESINVRLTALGQPTTAMNTMP